MKRSSKTIRCWLAATKQTSLAVSILNAVFGWAGHLARMPPDSPLSRVLHFRNLAWWRQTQLSK
eukprot:170292-Heterocapsa_arctica.AAC.1